MELAKRCGRVLTQTTIQSMEDRDSKASKHAGVIADALGVRIEWLLYGEAPRRRVASGDAPAATVFDADLQGDNYSQGPEMQRTVPLISWVQAGPFTLAEDPEDVSACPRIETTTRASRRAFALRVENDSMSPVFPPGTILIVDPEEEALSGRYVIVGNGSGEATFKQLVRDGEDWLLRPINPQFPVKPMPAHYRVIGVVVASEQRHI